MIRANKTKAKLKQGRMVVGPWLVFPSAAAVEIVASAGVDCVLLDAEHGGLTVREVEAMVRAAEVYDVTPIVRVPNHDPATICAFLDCGVQGIVAPHVNTREEAEGVARASRYHPEGQRGYLSSGRPARWGGTDRFEY